MAGPYVYRIHPAIGIGRVGNSEEFFIGPESAAGLPQWDQPGSGGLPIDPGTGLPIRTDLNGKNLRDASGKLKRQASRFRIYRYPASGPGGYPSGQGVEVTIGSSIDGRTVTDIVWTVHVANKKANTYVLLEISEKVGQTLDGIQSYEGKLPPLRNPTYPNLYRRGERQQDPNQPRRLTDLQIDPGPRAIRGRNGKVTFAKGTTPSYGSGASIVPLPNYPVSFPSDRLPVYKPTGQDITTLGELRTDAAGRLLVAGGYGLAISRLQADGQPFPLGPNSAHPNAISPSDVNNDGWYDDTSDGPVSATLVFQDGGTERTVGAWTVTTDPSFAPQTLNVVSLWDDVYNSWITSPTLNLQPDLYQQGRYPAGATGFNPGYTASFAPASAYPPAGPTAPAGFLDDLRPIFQSVPLQRWNTNLNSNAVSGHEQVGAIGPTTSPSQAGATGLLNLVRDPFDPSEAFEGGLMPLALGDANESFLSLRETQRFFLQQWAAGKFRAAPGPTLSPGENLDRNVLLNCLGGRFSPGIDLTFVVRQPELYVTKWQGATGPGPFRVNPTPLDYSRATTASPFLREGYVPLHPFSGATGPGATGLEPGDLSKFLAIPWHTDYNSCAVHQPNPNPPSNDFLYWSWPAQRPVAVYAAKDVRRDGTLGPQRFSVRGPGTYSKVEQTVGIFQDYTDMVLSWHRIGMLVQGSAIAPSPTGPTAFIPAQYLEVGSQLADAGGNVVKPWPIHNNEPAGPTAT